MFTFRDSSVFGFYFGSSLVISSGHCCVDFFRLVFGVRGFTCGSLLFLSFVFVRGASHGFVGCGMIILFRTKDLPSFINNRLSSRCSECTAARFKYPASQPGGGGRYTLPLRAVSPTRHSPLSSQPEWMCVA